jgi:hypothetical protein
VICREGEKFVWLLVGKAEGRRRHKWENAEMDLKEIG